jgi:hypothetical protein
MCTVGVGQSWTAEGGYSPGRIKLGIPQRVFEKSITWWFANMNRKKVIHFYPESYHGIIKGIINQPSI